MPNAAIKPAAKSPAKSRAQPSARSADEAKSAANGMLLLDHQLCFALYSASLTMTKVYKPMLRELGVTYPQYLVLLALWERDEVTVSEVGERLFLDSGTLTPLLKRLEAQGLIARRRSAQDERQVIVSLTADGRKLRAKAQKIPPEILCASGCTLPEIGDVTRRVQKLRRSLAGFVKED